MAGQQLDELLDELGLRLRHTFGDQLRYLGTTTTDEEYGTADVDVLIVLSQVSDAHIRLVWNVVSSVRHSWNVILDCRIRTPEDLGKQPLFEQYLLKECLRDSVGENPFRSKKISLRELRQDCRDRIAKQEDRILGLLPSVMTDVNHLRTIGNEVFDAVRAFLVLTGQPVTSKREARNVLAVEIPAFEEIQSIFTRLRNPSGAPDVPGFVASALAIVKHLSYRARSPRCSSRVLLVNAPSALLPHPMDELFGYDANMPLGLLCVGSHLRGLGVPVDLLDAYALNLTATGAVDAVVREYGLPRVVAFNASSPNIHVVHTMAEYLKRISDDVFIVVGGPHATLSTAHALSSSYVDFAIVGEGELPFGELAKALLNGDGEPREIPGVFTRGKNGLPKGRRQRDALPLRSLPVPALDLLPLEDRYFSHRRRAYIHTSRGCAFRCSYCSVHNFWGSPVREVPMDVVLDHIAALQRDFKVSEIQVVDDNFSHRNGQRIKAFCSGLVGRGINIRWKCQVRADQLNTELVELMAKNGCFEVDIGIESGNARIQKQIGKNLKLDKAGEAVKALHDWSIACKAFFILGFPAETWNEMQDSINLAVQLKDVGLLDVAFFPAMPFPGTKLADYAVKVLGAELTQGGLMDDRQKYVGMYALTRLRKYAAIPEVSLNANLTPRQLRMLCAFAYTCFEKGDRIVQLENAFNSFAAAQEAMWYGS